MGFTQLWRRIQRLCLYRRTAYRDFIRPDHRPGLPWTVGTWQGQNPPLHPRKKTPYITFSCKRIEKERIVFPSSVYDERKKNFKERIEAMLYYAEEADFCRNKVLLHYFGEKKTHNPANNVTFAGYGNLIHMRMLRTNKSSRLYWRL